VPLLARLVWHRLLARVFRNRSDFSRSDTAPAMFLGARFTLSRGAIVGESRVVEHLATVFDKVKSTRQTASVLQRIGCG
jgi:hypothetical protein